MMMRFLHSDLSGDVWKRGHAPPQTETYIQNFTLQSKLRHPSQQARNSDIADFSPIAFLAQSVERTTLNRVVVGSIPTEGACFLFGAPAKSFCLTE